MEGAPSSEGVCHFQRLPSELVSMICEFANPESDDIKILTRKNWERREEYRFKRSPDDHTPRPYTPKVSDWLVSKAFFAHAARAWLGSQKWTPGRLVGKVTDPWYSPDTAMFRNGLFQQSVTELTARSVQFDVDFLRGFSRLRKLQIVMSTADMEPPESRNKRMAWHHDFTNQELLSLPIVKSVVKVAPLKEVELEAGICIYVHYGERDDTWRCNIEKLQHLMMEQLRLRDVGIRQSAALLARSAGSVHADQEDPKQHICMPLYLGSHVCSGCDRMCQRCPLDSKCRCQWRSQSLQGRPTQKSEKSITAAATPLACRRLKSGGILHMAKDIPESKEALRVLVKTRPELATDLLWEAKERARALEEQGIGECCLAVLRKVWAKVVCAE